MYEDPLTRTGNLVGGKTMLSGVFIADGSVTSAAAAINTNNTITATTTTATNHVATTITTIIITMKQPSQLLPVLTPHSDKKNNHVPSMTRDSAMSLFRLTYITFVWIIFTPRKKEAVNYTFFS